MYGRNSFEHSPHTPALLQGRSHSCVHLCPQPLSFHTVPQKTGGWVGRLRNSNHSRLPRAKFAKGPSIPSDNSNHSRTCESGAFKSKHSRTYAKRGGGGPSFHAFWGACFTN